MSTEINTSVAIPATELDITIPMDGIEDLIQDKLDSDAFDAISTGVSDMISEEAWGAVEDSVDDAMRYNAWDHVRDEVISAIEEHNESGDWSESEFIDKVDEYRGIVERANNSDEVVDQPNLCLDGKAIYKAIHETVKHINGRTAREDAYNSVDLTAEASEIAQAQTDHRILSVDERILILDKQVDDLKKEVANLKDALLVATKNVIHTLELEVQ